MLRSIGPATSCGKKLTNKSGRIRAGFACGEFPALDVYVRDTFLVRYIASGNVPHEESVLDGKDADGKDVKKDEE